MVVALSIGVSRYTCFFPASDLNRKETISCSKVIQEIHVLFFFHGTLNVYHQRKTALCLLLSTTTIQHHKLLQHHKVRTSQVWWLNLITDLVTVTVIHVPENCKNQNNHTKVEKATGLFFRGHGVNRCGVECTALCCNM